MSQEEAGTGARVLANISLDRKIGSGGKGRSTVYGGGAVGAEVWEGRIPGEGGWAEYIFRAKGKTGVVE